MTLADLTIVTAFVAGIASFFSPCIIPVLPGFFAFLGGNAAGGSSRRRLFGSALLFVLGFSIIFILLGIGAQILGRPLAAERALFEKIGGALLVIFGLTLSGVFHFPKAFQIDPLLKRVRDSGAFLRDILFGIIFGFAWIPCIGPILGAVLFLATGTETAMRGGFLLASFSLGMGLPFLLCALMAPEVRKMLRRISWLSHISQLIFGGIIVLLGLLLFFGKLGVVSGWLVGRFGVGFAQ